MVHQRTPMRRQLHLNPTKISRRIKVVRNLALHDLFDNQFKITPTVPINQRPRTLHQLNQSTLNQRAQLKTTTHTLDNLVALQRINHKSHHSIPPPPQSPLPQTTSPVPHPHQSLSQPATSPHHTLANRYKRGYADKDRTVVRPATFAHNRGPKRNAAANNSRYTRHAGGDVLPSITQLSDSPYTRVIAHRPPPPPSPLPLPPLPPPTLIPFLPPPFPSHLTPVLHALTLISDLPQIHIQQARTAKTSPTYAGDLRRVSEFQGRPPHHVRSESQPKKPFESIRTRMIKIRKAKQE